MFQKHSSPERFAGYSPEHSDFYWRGGFLEILCNLQKISGVSDYLLHEAPLPVMIFPDPHFSLISPTKCPSPWTPIPLILVNPSCHNYQEAKSWQFYRQLPISSFLIRISEFFWPIHLLCRANVSIENFNR